MWDLLRRYKTDNVQSTLPVHTHDNTSPDPRIWKLGPLTLDPQAWYRFGYTLGHHLLRHKTSPYNEEAAQKLTEHFAGRALLHEVEHPTLPVDPILRGYYTTRTYGWNQRPEFRQIPRRWWNHKPHDPGSWPKVYKVPTWSVQHVMGTWNPTSSAANVPYAANLQGWWQIQGWLSLMSWHILK